MEQQHGASNKIDVFLEDVAEQIQYKPIRDEIKEELAAHIEDKKEEYIWQGLDDTNAQDKAIDDMGDAVEIGVRFAYWILKYGWLPAFLLWESIRMVL